MPAGEGRGYKGGTGTFSHDLTENRVHSNYRIKVQWALHNLEVGLTKIKRSQGIHLF